MNNKTINNLQILRGIAAALVVLYHANMLLGGYILFEIFNPGRCGVDLFFVISGFIIFYTNHRLGEKSSYLKQYFIRRLIRIYPIHWITLFTILLFCLFFSAINSYKYTFDWELIVKSFFLWPTYVPKVMPINPVTWTLSHEVFFYLLFGVSVAIGKRFLVVILFFWSLIMLIFLQYHTENAFLQMLTNTKNIEFIYGCIIALVIEKSVNKKIYYILLALGLIFLLLAWHFVWKGAFSHGRFDFILFGLPFSLIVYSLIKLENKGMSKLKKVFIFLGNASYSIYLTHFTLVYFIIYFTEDLHYKKSLLFCSVSFISIVFGALFFLLLEKPMIDFLRKSAGHSYKPSIFGRIGSSGNILSQ